MCQQLPQGRTLEHAQGQRLKPQQSIIIWLTPEQCRQIISFSFYKYFTSGCLRKPLWPLGLKLPIIISLSINLLIMSRNCKKKKKKKKCSRSPKYQLFKSKEKQLHFCSMNPVFVWWIILKKPQGKVLKATHCSFGKEMIAHKFTFTILIR